MAFYQFYKEQQINTSLEEIWDFISSPRNLKLITPDYMGFDITSPNLSEKMYEGMIISYKVSPLLGIKTDWVTEIKHIREMEYFVDEQRVGPYSLWHHQHMVAPNKKGVMMKDVLTYAPPFGIVGAIANKLIIKKKLDEIFSYRKTALEKKYGVS